MKTPPPSAWLSQVENAHSIAELTRTLRDYVASLNPEELAQLPDGLGLASVDGAGSIQEWAVTLAQHDLRSGTETAGALHRSAVVFAAAGAKLPKLAE